MRDFRRVMFLLLAILALLAGAARADAQKRCVKGKPVRQHLHRAEQDVSDRHRLGDACDAHTARRIRPRGRPVRRQLAAPRLLLDRLRRVEEPRTGEPAVFHDARGRRARRLHTVSRSRGRAGPAALGHPPPETTDADAADARPLEGTCTVRRVIDGDTVECAEGAERIRLLLIDAPEMDQGDYGLRSKALLETLLPAGTDAAVEVDIQERDRYGRVLAYLYAPDGTMVNEELARAGYAVVSVYPPNVRYVERMRAAQVAAREGRRGLWSGSAFECLPADHRRGRCE